MPGATRISNKSKNAKELAKIAKEELGETPEIRASTLKEFRKLIQANKIYANSIRKDDSFCLRFLRYSKFDVDEAFKILEKYVKARLNNPHWFANLDDEKDKAVNELISCGYIFVLPERDSEGRRILYSKASAMDSSKFTTSDVMKAFILTYEALLEDEDVQIRGISYIFDERETNWSHISIWTPSEITKAFQCTEKSLPLRHKSVNFVHLPWTLTIVFQFAKSLLSQKIRERLFCHSDFDGLIKSLNIKGSILPQDSNAYSDTPIDKLISSWKNELNLKKKNISELNKMTSLLIALNNVENEQVEKAPAIRKNSEVLVKS